MEKLLFIGPAPQNIGGISIHIRRLAGLLKKDYIFDYVDEGHTSYEGVFNLRSGNVFKYLAKVAKADIVHINSGIWSLRALNIIACKLILRKKVIVTIHRDPNIEPHTGLTKWLLKKCDTAILVNKEGYDTMRTDSKCNYVLLPAFLPPDMNEEPELPVEITKWIDSANKKDNSYVMCSNAYRLMMHNGEDLYGLDMCIEAMCKLQNGKNDLQYYLLFVLASNPDQHERLSGYKDIISQNGLTERLLIWESPASFVRVLQKCDLVLRTTNTDGDAVSIREAQFLGKPVLASDVVGRPDGVYLFKTRDVEDLTTKIKEISAQKKQIEKVDAIDFQALYHSIYD